MVSRTKLEAVIILKKQKTEQFIYFGVHFYLKSLNFAPDFKKMNCYAFSTQITQHTEKLL